MRGYQFLLFVFIPIISVSCGLFVYFQPRVTQIPDDVLRCYVRFEDQHSLFFIAREDYQAQTVSITFENQAENFQFVAEGLRKMKNWVPIEPFPDGKYEITIKSNGYQTLETNMQKVDNTFSPHPENRHQKALKLEDNFLGIIMEKDRSR